MSGKLFCRNILIYNVLMGFSSRREGGKYFIFPEEGYSVLLLVLQA